MITHLREREKNLEPFGWNPQDAEWVALVCLHSGVFTRAQYMAYCNAHPEQARRFVQGLLDLKLAVEEPIPVIRRENRTRACRITHKGIYRELGVPNIRHRRFPDPGAYLRRLLSLDYVIEHPELEWLPTEEEKVWYCGDIGIPTRTDAEADLHRGGRGRHPVFPPEAPRCRRPDLHVCLCRSRQRHLHGNAALGPGARASLGGYAGTQYQGSCGCNRSQPRRRQTRTRRIGRMGAGGKKSRGREPPGGGLREGTGHNLQRPRYLRFQGSRPLRRLYERPGSATGSWGIFWHGPRLMTSGLTRSRYGAPGVFIPRVYRSTRRPHDIESRAFFQEYAATAMNRANGALIHKANSQGQFTVLIHTVVVPYLVHSLGVRPFQDAVPELLQTGGAGTVPEGESRAVPDWGSRAAPEGVQRQGRPY